MIVKERYYLRNPDAIIVSTTEQCLFIADDGSVFEFEVQNPARWSMLMQILTDPISGDALLKHLGGFLEIHPNYLAPLLSRGFLLEATTPDKLQTLRDKVFTHNQGYHLDRGDEKCEHLLVVLTGSITSGLMAPTILSLCYSGFHRKLDLILTEAALKFANRDLFEHYGIRTWVDPFDRRDGIHVPHVALGQSADCILVMPASAASCKRLAEGACTDLLSMTVVASVAPVVVAPVMNTAMWNNAAVQRNVQQMRDDAMYVIEPTLIFSAAELVEQGDPMYGGPGTFWRGALGVMQTLSAIMEHRRKSRPMSQSQEWCNSKSLMGRP